MTSDRSTLSRLLLSRIPSNARNVVGPNASFTRRAFLAGAVSTGAAAASLGIGESPRVSGWKNNVTVEFGGHEWVIEGRYFGPSAQASFIRSADGFRITLVSALLPGTDIAFDLSASLQPSLSGWRIDLDLPSWAFRSSAPLGSWIAGAEPLTSSAVIVPFAAGGLHISGAPQSSVSLFNPWRVLAESDGFDIASAASAFEQAAPLLRSAEFELRLRDGEEGTFRNALLGHTASVATEFSAQGSVAAGTPMWIGGNAEVECVDFLPDGDASLRLEAFGERRAQQGVMLLEGPGVLRVGPKPIKSVNRGGIRLEHASLLTAIRTSSRVVALAGRISRAPHFFDAGGAQVCIAGEDNEPVYLHARDDSVAGTLGAARLHELLLPVPDADSATATFPAVPVRLVLPQVEDSGIPLPESAVDSEVRPAPILVQATATAPAAIAPTGSMVVFGRNGYVLSGLDRARVRLKRGVDLFNLEFSFEGFVVRVYGGKALLLRPEPERPRDDYSEASVTVHFPPQHIAEDWFPVQNPAACMTNAPCFPEVTRARMSGPSRVVFSVDRKRSKKVWARRELTIVALTEWSQLALEVNARALPSDATFEDQMKLVGIQPDTSLVDAMSKISESLQEPTAKQTQLELAGRLIFSPAKGANWITPRQVHAEAAPLWTARLDDKGRSSTRAIWSRYMVPKSYTLCNAPDDPGAPQCTPPDPSRDASKRMLVLDNTHHWELVGQTSVYGLPALRRIIENPNPSDSIEVNLKDLPRSRVVRADYKLLREMDRAKGFTNSDSGIAMPAVFADADIMLTSLGGIVNADWHGEPPNLLSVDPSLPGNGGWAGYVWPRTFDLERFGYRLHMAREIRVEAVHKGYLVPLSVRASFVQLTERMFFRHPKFGTPYAYPVQRSFIVIQKPVKPLPGVNQPYASRDFPAQQIVMRTKVTPDLVAPVWPGNGPILDNVYGVEVRNGGQLTFPSQNDVAKKQIDIFWPTVVNGPPGSGGDVEFKWTVDADDAPITSKLLFVSNRAVGYAPLMQDIVNFYRRLQQPVADAAISASSTAFGTIDALKDGNTSTSWGSDTAVVAVLTFDLGTPKRIEQLTLTADATPNRAPKSFSVSASATGAFGGEQTVVLTKTGENSWKSQEKRSYSLQTSSPFRFFRLTITDSEAGAGGYRLSEAALWQRDYGMLRIARHSGARRRYAPTETDGDTTFDTDSWLLSARGRITQDRTGNDVENFVMDGRMEGGDQPPCYPVMESAQVNIQSLDHLLGRPQGLITVGFNDVYVTDRSNPSDIYLNLLGPDIQLNVTGQSTTSGGVAQPNSLAVALSRKIGIVGGQRKSKVAAAPPARPLTAFDNLRRPRTLAVRALGTGSPSSPYSFGAAQDDGKFSAKEFLGGLTKAKLLGLVPLDEVLSVVDIGQAPKLIERIGFGGLGSETEEQALTQIKNFLFSPTNGDNFAKRLTDRLKEVQDAIAQPIPDPTHTATVFAKDVYPELYKRFVEFKAGIDVGLVKIKNATKLGEVTEQVSDIVILGRPLGAELDRILHDPVPPIVKDLIKSVEAAWLSLRDLVNGGYISIGRDLAAALIASSLKSLCEVIDRSGLPEVLLGDPNVTAAQILANPSDALDRLGRSLFDEVLGEPLQRAVGPLLEYQSQVTAKLAWAERKVAQAVLSAIVDASESIRSELQPPANPDTDTDNILAAPARAALRDAVASACKTAIAPIIAGKTDAATIGDVRDALEASKRALPAALRQLESGVKVAVEAQKALFKAKVAGDIDQLIATFEAAVVPAVRNAVERDLTPRLEALEASLVDLLQETRAAAINRIGSTVDTVLQAIASTALYARIAQAGRAVQNWCDANSTSTASARIVTFADDVASRLLADAGVISTALTNLLASADKLDPPSTLPGDAVIKFNAAKAAIKSGIQQIAAVAIQIADAREMLRKIRQNDAGSLKDACTKVASFLNPAAALMRLRGEALTAIQDIVGKIQQIEALISSSRSVARFERVRSGVATPAFVAGTVSLDAVIKELISGLASLVAGVTSIGKAAISPVWNDVQALIDAVGNDAAFSGLKNIPGYSARASSLADDLKTAAARIRAGLQDANLTSAVLGQLSRDATAYARDLEKQLASHILQSVTLTASDAAALADAAAAAVKALASRLVAFHVVAENSLDALYNAMNAVGVRDIIQLVLADPTALSKFAASIQRVKDDHTKLKAIVDSANSVAAFDATVALLNSWYPGGSSGPGPALIQTLGQLADLAESFLRGDLGDVVARLGIKDALQEIKSDIESAIAELLPTRVDLGYDWQTSLGQFPADNYVFKMSGGTSDDDLTIGAHISVNFLTGARSTTITGKMKPFEVWLVTRSIDIATIKFRGASFTSVDGSDPKFDADIDTVVLGTFVQFIKPLQAWLSPSDSGFYLTPTFSPVGLEVGYTYDAGIIQVGTLQFINVALGAAARLPFNGDEAEFEFHFASKERPFLIACPPYGGGGFVQLIANARSIKGFSLSFQFGAVVAIRFGPLNAQGRVTAGVYLASYNGGRTIAAFVEAVGEGNIACFSICVCIQVGLVQQVQGDRSVLYGFSSYSVTFKVGFVSVKLGFTAVYTVQGDRSAASNRSRLRMLPGDCKPLICQPPVDRRAPRYVTLTPRKGSEWRSYRQHISMDLLS